VTGLLTLACPACGGRLPQAVASPTLALCPNCGTPVAVVSIDTPARRVLRPRQSAQAAAETAARAFRHDMAPPGFPGRNEPARLLYVACYEVERTLVGGAGHVVETLARGLAAKPRELGLERLDLNAVLAGASLESFDPSELQREALVFDPLRRVADVLPVVGGLRLLEERVVVVYVPVWLVRCRYRGRAYEAVIDATLGALLTSRAPVERTARLGQAVALLYPLGLVAGVPVDAWPRVLEVALRIHPIWILWVLGALLFLLSWTWDRVRFRYELVREADQARLDPINRPDYTLPERVGRFLLRLVPFRARSGWGAQ